MNAAAAFDAFAKQIATSKGASVLVVCIALVLIGAIPQTAPLAPFIGVCIILTQLYGGKQT